ncbi:tautomerase family protein [Cohnella xylanilytica]|uniref:Tautomerase family protein n=1 Tax=Cohnella xylanilytica TaxID=557555 RepID=A0A841U4U8_9BACL|nr:tautomerase family protein [Cohnella xylanilytica]MBB6694592.1 tautomerase family protein [Cohnella xylanilytica]
MAQVKIYGIRERLRSFRETLSDIVHQCLVEAFGLPEDKRFQRFFGLDKEDFLYPPDRSEHYTIIEIVLFEGRSADAKKNLIRLLYERTAACGLTENDLEIVLIESPRSNWGIRGVPGDELGLSYRVDV